MCTLLCHRPRERRKQGHWRLILASHLYSLALIVPKKSPLCSLHTLTDVFSLDSLLLDMPIVKPCWTEHARCSILENRLCSLLCVHPRMARRRWLCVAFCSIGLKSLHPGILSIRRESEFDSRCNCVRYTELCEAGTPEESAWDCGKVSTQFKVLVGLHRQCTSLDWYEPRSSGASIPQFQRDKVLAMIKAATVCQWLSPASHYRLPVTQAIDDDPFKISISKSV